MREANLNDAVLGAVIFDVDGTLADTERHGHRIAFNRAFEKAGLPDRWDEELYGELLAVTGGQERILHYFTERRPEPPPEDPEALAEELHKSKVAELEELIQSGDLEARPGVARLMDELDRERIDRVVATTGTRSTVLDLLASLGFGQGFAAVLTADEAPAKKPEPQVYDMILENLGLSPHEALAVEDSRNGLLAARAAGIPCLYHRLGLQRRAGVRRGRPGGQRLGRARRPGAGPLRPARRRFGKRGGDRPATPALSRFFGVSDAIP